eukprot:m.154338 g.154338  ORF g.154338 m.154338 type:complete len:70 (+) comp14298_c0_seq16:3740-3949(+)
MTRQPRFVFVSISNACKKGECRTNTKLTSLSHLDMLQSSSATADAAEAADAADALAVASCKLFLNESRL